MRARTQDSKWRVPSAPLNQLCRQSHPASRLAEANFARHQHLIAAFVLEEIKGLTVIFESPRKPTRDTARDGQPFAAGERPGFELHPTLG